MWAGIEVSSFPVKIHGAEHAVALAAPNVFGRDGAALGPGAADRRSATGR